MNSRKPTNSHIDREIFVRTAVRTRRVNVNPTSMRGGIRM